MTITEVPELPWLALVHSELYPAEVFLRVNVTWDVADWSRAKSLKSKANAVISNQNNIAVAEASELTQQNQLEQTKEQQVSFLRALDNQNGMLVQACKLAKVPMRTYRSWMVTDKLFKEAVDEIAQGVLDTVEGKLIQEAQEGDINAIRYFMDARGNDRGYGKREVAVKEEQQELDLTKLTLKEQQQLAKLIQKATPIEIN